MVDRQKREVAEAEASILTETRNLLGFGSFSPDSIGSAKLGDGTPWVLTMGAGVAKAFVN